MSGLPSSPSHTWPPLPGSMPEGRMGDGRGGIAPTLGLAELRFDQAVEGVGDRLVAVPRGVLADERGSGRGLTKPGHQLLGAGPGS